MYTRTVPRPRELRPRHSVVNQWDLLHAIEGDRPSGEADPARDAVEMPLDPTADARVAARLRRAGVADEDDLIVAHVSAGNPFRRWPEPAFVDVLARLAERDARRRIVISSGPSDRDAARRIMTAARSRLGETAAAPTLPP